MFVNAEQRTKEPVQACDISNVSEGLYHEESSGPSLVFGSQLHLQLQD